MDYHLFFMAVSFCLLFLTVFLLFIDNTKEKTMAGAVIAGINYLVCMICSFGFFGIGIIGIDGVGSAVITAHHDMMVFYSFFFMLYWLNIVFIFYCYWLWVRNPWDIGNVGSSEVDDLKGGYMFKKG